MVSWTNPFTAVTNAFVSSSAFNAGVRDNLLYIRQFLSNNPGAAGWVLQATGTEAAAWRNAFLGLIVDRPLTVRGFGGNHSEIDLYNATNTEYWAVTPDDSILYFIHSTAGVRLQIPESGDMLFGGATVWHSGNLTPSSLVPSGLIAAFANAAGIPAGWSRFTNGDGRFLVGDGTTFGQTFVEGASAGSSWAHQHAATGLTMSTVGDGSVASGGGSTATPAHAHTMSGSTSNTSWIPPSFAVVWAIKS